MATYTNQDIACSHDGDLELGINGDLKLLDALETNKRATNFVLRTDYGDYAPNPNVGCNLGTFVGERNVSEVHEKMQFFVQRGISDEIYAPEDIAVTVLPFDLEEALCVVRIKGTYLVSGEFIEAIDQKMAYGFPYIEGQPSPLVI